MSSRLVPKVHQTLDLLIPKIQSLKTTQDRPIILGITGLQGAGKSSWASVIVKFLEAEHQLRAITVSLDDFYKTHDELVAQREKNPENLLYRTRGQPGTHDEALAHTFFDNVKAQLGEECTIKVPRFDKSRFHGEGDRAPVAEWPEVKGKVDVVVFEGWCIGFRALAPHVLEEKYNAAKSARGTTKYEDDPDSITTLADHELEHLQEVNRNLQRYNETFMGPQHFDFMIHIDTDNLKNVYRWRGQQERALIESKGAGMSYENVVAFVNGYMPAYELYLEGLREGFFAESGRQVHVTLGSERQLEGVQVI